ncbi:MAG TPA: fibronectin type III domain-containing protein [Kofleriaceae bacterium]|nr:fibronectin type III domain-containing protein [Kofleriaceae bacterium]
MRMLLLASFLIAGLIAGCTDPAEPPAAPTNLTVMALGAGAHLTWVDNSDNELEFAIQRMQVGSEPAMRELARVPFDGTQYHDEPIVPGATYQYEVIATNDGGDAASNLVTFVAP